MSYVFWIPPYNYFVFFFSPLTETCPSLHGHTCDSRTVITLQTIKTLSKCAINFQSIVQKFHKHLLLQLLSIYVTTAYQPLNQLIKLQLLSAICKIPWRELAFHCRISATYIGHTLLSHQKTFPQALQGPLKKNMSRRPSTINRHGKSHGIP